MPRTAKTWTVAELISDLTVARTEKGCTEPDLVINSPASVALFGADVDPIGELESKTLVELEGIRAIVPRKRKPRTPSTGTTTTTTRETFSKTGKTYITIPVVLDKDQIKAVTSLGHKTSKAVAGYISSPEFVTSTSDKGAGALAYVSKDDRSSGCKIVNVNGIVASAVDGIEERAQYRKHLLKMQSVHAAILTMRDLQPEDKKFTRNDLRKMMTKAGRKAKYDPAEAEKLIAEILSSNNDEDDDSDE